MASKTVPVPGPNRQLPFGYFPPRLQAIPRYTVSSFELPGGNGLPPQILQDMVEECNVLHDMISNLGGKSVRRVVREHWEKTLIGSDEHTRFVVSTISNLAVSTPDVSF
jgi:hypothetical protein